jgi:transposase
MAQLGSTQLWRRRLDDCAKSGKTVVYWCYLNNVSVPKYYYWKRKLAAQPTQAAPGPEFIPVALVEAAPPPPADTGVTVHLAGAKIELTSGFDPATLRAVVVALSALPC